jgi:aspartyl-tRNA(Asn)/glutamyl-tRNA(Gln) amidotransferase subunit B
MRIKEDAHDYRYFPDPDLLPLAVSEQWIGEIRSQMPELPQAMRARFVGEYALSESEATTLTQSREFGRYFESTAFSLRDLVENSPTFVGHRMSGIAKAASNWVLGEVSSRLNDESLEIEQSKVRPAQLAELILRTFDQTLNRRTAKEVFDAMWAGEGEADAIIERKGLRQISDAGAIEAIVAGVLAANPKQVEDYRAGKEKAFNSLVGQVMKATKGKANPAQVNELLRKKLAG